MSRRECGGRGDGGSVTVELAVLMPLVALLVGVLVYAGRVSATHADVQGAAQVAARAASRARTGADADHAARAAAASSLALGGAGCRQVSVSAPAVAANEVSVTVSCVVDLSDVTMVPIGGSLTVTESWTEPVDVVVESELVDPPVVISAPDEERPAAPAAPAAPSPADDVKGRS